MTHIGVGSKYASASVVGCNRGSLLIQGTMRKVAKALFEQLGIRCSRISKIPAGIDKFLDINRLKDRGVIETIFDVGANVGDFTKRFAEQFPKSQVYGFEPVPDTYRVLCQNTSRLSSVTCVNTALGATRERRQIITQSDSEWNSLVPVLNMPSGAGGRSLEVAVTTIDEFCQEQDIGHINILKTDTEGFDLEVLSGARRMLCSGSVDFVLSEAGFSRDDHRHTYFVDLFTLLSEHGFVFAGLYDGVFGAHGMDFCNALFRRATPSRPYDKLFSPVSSKEPVH